MKTMLDKLYCSIYKYTNILMIISIVLITALTFLNIIARITDNMFAWAEEVSRLAFVWMSFLGISIAYKKKLHPQFNLILNKISTEYTRLLNTLIYGLILFFLLFLLKGGLTYIATIKIQKTAVLGISVAWKYSAVVFATVMMLMETIRHLVITWRHM